MRNSIILKRGLIKVELLNSSQFASVTLTRSCVRTRFVISFICTVQNDPVHCLYIDSVLGRFEHSYTYK
jgi:hypothetical protein